MTLKIGITGAGGYIGSVLQKYPGFIPLSGDVSDPLAMEMAIKSERPDLIVHLAAKTNPDWCELKTSQPFVDKSNVKGTYTVAEIAEKYNCQVVMVSTYHVFSGKKRWGNTFSENDRPDPINTYGFSKFGAETFRFVFDNLKVVRTSQLFSMKRLEGHLYALGCGNQPYPTFLTRSFLHVNHFCEFLYSYCLRYEKMPSLLHYAGCDTVSWYDFMNTVSSELGTKYRPTPRKDEWQGYMASRPHKGGLNISRAKKLGFIPYSFLDGIKLLGKEK